MIGEVTELILHGGIFFPPPASQLVKAVVPRNLTEPGAERRLLILLVQDSAKLQENLSGSVFGIFCLPKISPANPQNVLVVGRETLAQEFGADWLRFIQ